MPSQDNRHGQGWLESSCKGAATVLLGGSKIQRSHSPAGLRHSRACSARSSLRSYREPWFWDTRYFWIGCTQFPPCNLHISKGVPVVARVASVQQYVGPPADGQGRKMKDSLWDAEGTGRCRARSAEQGSASAGTLLMAAAHSSTLQVSCSSTVSRQASTCRPSTSSPSMRCAGPKGTGGEQILSPRASVPAVAQQHTLAVVAGACIANSTGHCGFPVCLPLLTSTCGHILCRCGARTGWRA